MRRALLAAGLVSTGACSSAPDPVPDWERFYADSLSTLVVLPPENLTVDAEAPRFFTATITQPLANRGYYVLPVEPIAEMMAAEGLGEGGALAAVQPARFRQFLGADGVLYVTIRKWDTSYQVIAASVTVAMDYRLVSTRTGEELWRTSAESVVRSDSGSVGSGGLITALAQIIVSTVSAAVTAASTDYVPLASKANVMGLASLPPGPYHPQFEAAKQKNLAAFSEYKRDLAEWQASNAAEKE